MTMDNLESALYSIGDQISGRISDFKEASMIRLTDVLTAEGQLRPDGVGWFNDNHAWFAVSTLIGMRLVNITGRDGEEYLVTELRINNAGSVVKYHCWETPIKIALLIRDGEFYEGYNREIEEKMCRALSEYPPDSEYSEKPTTDA